MKKIIELIIKMKSSGIDLSDDKAVWDFIAASDCIPEIVDEDIDPVEELFVDVMQELEKGESGMLAVLVRDLTIKEE